MKVVRIMLQPDADLLDDDDPGGLTEDAFLAISQAVSPFGDIVDGPLVEEYE